MKRALTLGRAAVGAFVASALWSCGARNELPPGEDACALLGSTRPCENPCGQGEQECVEGRWQECEVEPTEVPCTNECGDGFALCENGSVGECVTPPNVRPCEDACGFGEQICEDGEWQACEVPPMTRFCTNLCGTGEETCRGGEWSGCEVPVVRVPCESVCGGGEVICQGGTWRDCNAPLPKPPTLASVVRDFSDAHPDFELPLSGDHVDLGLVLRVLGPDDKPVYSGKIGSQTTSGAANFDQWYRDVPGVNVATSIDLQLTPSTERRGLFVFSDRSFFPIDGFGFGNQGRNHNYHFTLEARTRFEYRGGEIFRFTGDDDMWVFINRRLAIDLGGIHRSLEETVVLDARAAELGLTRGETYPLHFFFAERKVVDSNFTIETSISEPGSCQ